MALAALALVAGLAGVAAGEDGTPGDADRVARLLHGAKPTLDVRARYEYGKQDGLRGSNSTTLRLRLGIETPEIERIKLFAELEATEALDRDSYQAASVHGLGRRRTVIADPESSELNRLWAAWSGFDSNVKLGRQRIVFADARFVGNVGWRQNEQTYDAVRLDSTRVSNLSFHYAWLWRVKRIYGSGGVALASQDDFDSRSHIALLSYELPGATIEVYAYLLDLDNRAGNNASNNSYGLSLSGVFPLPGDVSARYRAEYAHQQDAARSTLDYRADYVRAELSGTRRGATLGLGYEMLGAGQGVGFQTPLATLHKWNGFADVFLATPAEGLIDMYAHVALPLPGGLQLRAAYHDFVQEDSRGDFGSEIDVVLTKKLEFGIAALAKYASYRTRQSGDARPLGSDLRRFVFQLEYSY